MTRPVGLPVLTAVTGAWEAALVTGLEQVGGAVVVVRRCVDLADLIATAGTGQARAVVVSADLRRLDGEAMTRLEATGVAIVGLVDPGDEPAERRLRQLGVGEVLAVDAAPHEVAEAVGRAVTAVDARVRSDPLVGPGAFDGLGLADPAQALPSGPDRHLDLGPDLEPDRDRSGETVVRTGRLIAVWGPTGAPGRTTIAVTLAAELARLASAGDRPDRAAGRDVLLADADTYGGSVAQALGLLDEAPGLAAAARAADHGTLDVDQLARSAPYVLPHLRVLTGIVRPERWPELRPAALSRVFASARRLAAWTVVDCGFSIEQDEELSYDTAVPRRNGATLVTLADADLVIAVGAADPVGLQRLVRGLAALADLAVGAPVVVVNRVRGSAVGGHAEARVREALERYAGVLDAHLVPDDRVGVDAALLAGRTLTEAAPTSPARLAIARLAQQLVDEAAPARPEQPVTRPGARRARRARRP